MSILNPPTPPAKEIRLSRISPAQEVLDDVDVVEHGGSVQWRLVLEVLHVYSRVMLKWTSSFRPQCMPRPHSQQSRLTSDLSATPNQQSCLPSDLSA